jgi:hypothetical protein
MCNIFKGCLTSRLGNVFQAILDSKFSTLCLIQVCLWSNLLIDLFYKVRYENLTIRIEFNR